VNAAGPWVDEIAGLDKKQNSRLKITKGIHLVFDEEKLPAKQSIYFEAADKRMLFVIPRNGKTYVGTTDTFYEGNMEDPKITMEDRDYVLSCINTYFGNELQPADIESAWVGLRPLINKPGKKAGEISRRDELFISDRGLITIAGGKLTGYRKMAERVMNVISQRFKKDVDQIIPPCTTDRVYLSGGKLDRPFDIFLKDKIAEGLTLGLTSKEASELVYRFGSNTVIVYDLMKKIRSGEIPASKYQLQDFLYAQLLYCVQYEQCLTVSDFLIRRTSLFYFDIKLAEKWRTALSEEMKEMLKFNTTFTRRMEDQLQVAFDSIHTLKL
jgi:glycerol-3-phosphate dehydrogenase